MPIGVGILGFAHGHVNSYCARWRKEPQLDISFVCGWDHDAQRMDSVCGELAMETAASADELLARKDIQAVVIAAETSLHAGLVEQAAAAGKAVVLQKPIALTMSDADRIVTAVRKADVPFTMAWQMRVDPQNLKIRELVVQKSLGKVFMLRRRHGLSMCLNDAFAKSWHVSPEYNRDIWADDTAHPIDFIYWILGMPESVTAEIASLHNPAMPNDNGIVILRYPGGPLAEVACSFTNRAGENTTEVVCERGTIIQNYGDVPSCNVPRPKDGEGLKWFDAEKGDWVSSDIPSPPNHGVRISDLAGPISEYLHGRRTPIATAEEGRAVLRIILATYLSSSRGRRVGTADDAVYEL